MMHLSLTKATNMFVVITGIPHYLVEAYEAYPHILV